MPAALRKEARDTRPAPFGSGSARRYGEIRQATVALCEGLDADDCQAQGMADASPVKWHVAHTTWFFDAFVLGGAARAPFAAQFNSYYQSVGAPYPRAQRGLLTRPSLGEVLAWRERVDAEVLAVLDGPDPGAVRAQRIELGLQHEQQHQELMLADLKCLFAQNPLRPAYRPLGTAAPPAGAAALRWLEQRAALVEIGHGGEGFCFDNELPRHRVWLDPHALASRPVTNGEYRQFVRGGGYREPLLWLADGWDAVQAGGWQRPLYWSEDGDSAFTLRGEQPLRPEEPVCHLSYFEADAYARWAGARLPREAEWEAAAAAWPVKGNFLDSGALQPRASAPQDPAFHGDVWEWTASAYAAYPGYRAPAGALGEYNGKFMCNQLVLRGGSCLTPPGHVRPSYRNFFPPHARWQCSGVRLARDLA
jgi:ergothioneine biosynthesis protein EgtB